MGIISLSLWITSISIKDENGKYVHKFKGITESIQNPSSHRAGHFWKSAESAIMRGITCLLVLLIIALLFSKFTHVNELMRYAMGNKNQNNKDKEFEFKNIDD